MIWDIALIISLILCIFSLASFLLRSMGLSAYLCGTLRTFNY